MTQKVIKEQGSAQGILLVNKPEGKTSFSIVSALRRRLNVKKIGHAGTLDPFATGVMVMLVGKEYTKQSDTFLQQDKEYEARLQLGVTTDSYDRDGVIIKENGYIPTPEEVEEVIASFNGEMEQIPPMFSAKKVAGKKLYELARQGKEIARLPIKIQIETELLAYQYPYIDIRVRCSKGTYIRSVAHDIGVQLGCGAHLTALIRTRSGPYHVSDCIDGAPLFDKDAVVDVESHLITG